MKNFSDLTAIESKLEFMMEVQVLHPCMLTVNVNNKILFAGWVKDTDTVSLQTQLPLLEPIAVQVDHQGAYVSSLIIDNWQARPQWGQELQGRWQFDTELQPFYQWHHVITGQGWLLQPMG